MFGFISFLIIVSMIVYYIQFTVNFFQIGKKEYEYDKRHMSRFDTKEDVRRALVPYTMWFDSLKERLNKLQ